MNGLDEIDAQLDALLAQVTEAKQFVHVRVSTGKADVFATKALGGKGSGIKARLTKTPAGSAKVFSILFDKDKFTAKAALAWAHKHGYKNAKIKGPEK